MANNNDIYRAIVKMCIKTARQITDDQEALAVKCLYKNWSKQLGRELTVGEYVQHGDRLYRVLTTHVAQANWEPGVGTESLFVVVDKTHAGTMEDSIPWNANMECEEGKYYSEDGVIYLCVRSSGIALQCKITDVLGNYFQVANGEEVEEPKEEEEEEIVEPSEPEVVEPEVKEEEGEVVEPSEPEVEEPKEEEEEVVAEEGTLELPIPYEVGVTQIENGKYYIENEVVYLCTRSENVMYHNLANLIGVYVTVVE